jgi:hypothetical protein
MLCAQDKDESDERAREFEREGRRFPEGVEREGGGATSEKEGDGWRKGGRGRECRG